ncbi:hypothetical protein A0256_00725 [Mucilaginibacter sp. PAMC 26640]|nr:hypothetical protein A0256_00725 [Mucilaginibacter sp. PAMC 26640]
MNSHDGQIIEFVVRKEGYNLTDLAKEINVNRRTIYNWFQSKSLKDNIIKTIGLTIRHDFSSEFSERFTPNDFDFKILSRKAGVVTFSIVDNDSDKWKDKYIILLEKYNELLLNETRLQEILNDEINELAIRNKII